jgi:hypothetical protein
MNDCSADLEAAVMASKRWPERGMGRHGRPLAKMDVKGGSHCAPQPRIPGVRHR